MDFLNSSLRLGRFAGINVRVHILFFVLIGWWLITSEDWRFELAFAAMLFGSVLIHEFGHCFGARSVGGYAENILMWPLGGLAYAQAPMRPWPQFVTIAAGPAVNVAFCVISAVVLIASTGNPHVVSLNPFELGDSRGIVASWQVYLRVFFFVNQILLYFNLLPVFPFDGGQLFRAIVWPFLGFQRATILAAQMGIVGALVLAGLGILWQDFMLIAIALFGGTTSYQHWQAARHGLLVEDEAFVPRPETRRGGGFWRRILRRRRAHWRSGGNATPPINPNPGGWEARQEDKRKRDAEIDRILAKVHNEGIHSLSYVERQTLECATRERQRQESEFERQNRV